VTNIRILQGLHCLFSAICRHVMKEIAWKPLRLLLRSGVNLKQTYWQKWSSSTNNENITTNKTHDWNPDKKCYNCL